MTQEWQKNPQRRWMLLVTDTAQKDIRFQFPLDISFVYQ